MADYFEEWCHRVDTTWASLPATRRQAMLRAAGHKELFAMTADALTIAEITIRYGERVSGSLVRQMGL